MRFTHRCFVAVFALALAGCSGESFDRVPLAGSVTIDGEPVAQGTIDFQPLESGQGPSTSAPIADGKYAADVPLGKLKVFFHATRETGKMVDVFGTPQPEIVNIIPPAYQSGTEVTVAAGDVARDFALVSP